MPIARPESLIDFIPRRPALAATVCFVPGILLHRALPGLPLLWGGVALALLIACVFVRQSIIANLLLATNLMLLGLGISQLYAFYYPDDDISAYATDQRRLAQLELHIEHEPRILTDPFAKRPLPPKQVATAEVRAVKTWDGWKPATGKILVQIAQPHPRLGANQTVRVLGRLERPSPAVNPGQFDWARYYRDQRILTSIGIEQARNIQIVQQHRTTVWSWIRIQSRQLLASGFASDDLLDYALLRALVLGDNDPELRDIQEQFRRTGTSHHLSISGLHVAVLGAFIYCILRLLRLRPRVIVLLATGFVALYGVAALPSPPVVRSVLLGLFVGIGFAASRQRDALHLLSVAMLAMLIYQPLDLYNAGFQLSFGTVMGLILFTPGVDRWIRSLNSDDLFVKRSWKTRSTLSQANDYIVRAFAAGVVAWMVSMPLVLFHFGQLNPYAVVASIVLAPVVFIALIGGFAKIVLTLCWPGGAALWAAGAAHPIKWMRGLLAWLDQIPGSDFPMPAPAILLVVGFYFFCLLMLIPYRKPRWHLLIRFGPVSACALVLMLPALRVKSAVQLEESLKFTLLSVGAGQCAILETPSGRSLLIDAGSSSLSDAMRKCIAPALRFKGITQIDKLILTHSDFDHISAAYESAGIYDVAEILTGPRFRIGATDNPSADLLLRQLDGIDLPPRQVQPGERIPLARDAEIEILWAPRAESLSPNDSSLVFQIRYAGKSILVTGDIQDAAQQSLLEYPGKLKADVLIAPHHGSAEDTTARFVAAVNPSEILSSNDRTLTGKQKRLVEVLGGRNLHRTSDCGAVTITIRRGGQIVVEPFLQQTGK